MASTVHSTGRASPFVLTYVAGILPQSENLELKICAIHLHSSLAAMSGVFSRGTDKRRSALLGHLALGQCDGVIPYPSGGRNRHIKVRGRSARAILAVHLNHMSRLLAETRLKRFLQTRIVQ